MADVRIKDLTELAAEGDVLDSHSIVVDNNTATRRVEIDTLREVMARDISPADIEAAPQDVTVEEVEDETYELTVTDRNKILLCTHVDGCTVTLPDGGMPAGWTCGIMQGDADDPVTLAAGGSAELYFSSDFADPPETVDQFDLIIVTVVTAGEATQYKVGGDLVAA
jgi:hypothetical protein